MERVTATSDGHEQVGEFQEATRWVDGKPAVLVLEILVLAGLMIIYVARSYAGLLGMRR